MEATSIQSAALFISAIATIGTVISTSLAVRGFNRQQRTSRLQNLVSVFQRFSNDDDFITIFSLCDEYQVKLDNPNNDQELELAKNNLASFDAKKKYKYLALLEEVAVLAKNDEIIRPNAIHLFRYHFFYVYGNNAVSDVFWSNVGSGKTEKKKKGWKYQWEFAQICGAGSSSIE